MNVVKFAIKAIILMSLAEYVVKTLGLIGIILVIAAAYYWFKKNEFEL